MFWNACKASDFPEQNAPGTFEAAAICLQALYHVQNDFNGVYCINVRVMIGAIQADEIKKDPGIETMANNQDTIKINLEYGKPHFIKFLGFNTKSFQKVKLRQLG